MIVAELTPQELRAIREQLGLRQSDLAKALGRSLPTISRWETGSMPIAHPREVRLALEGLLARQRAVSARAA